MPRVGSSSSSTLGSRHSQRASSTFCWLPPDSSPTLCSGLDALIRSRFMKTSTISSCLARGDEAGPGEPGQRGEHDVLADRQARDDPLGLAVLGQHRDAGPDGRGRAAAGAAAGRRPRPCRRRAAARRRSALAVSLRPAPSSPPSPTTSPGRTSTETVVQSVTDRSDRVALQHGLRAGRVVSRGVEGGCALAAGRSAMLAAEHQRDQLAAGRVRPSRRCARPRRRAAR